MLPNTLWRFQLFLHSEPLCDELDPYGREKQSSDNVNWISSLIDGGGTGLWEWSELASNLYLFLQWPEWTAAVLSHSLESVIIPKCLKLFTPASSPACAAPRPLKSILSFKRSTNIRYGTDPGGTSLCYPRHRRANIIIVIRSVAFAIVGWGSKSACLWENFPVQ